MPAEKAKAQPSNTTVFSYWLHRLNSGIHRFKLFFLNWLVCNFKTVTDTLILIIKVSSDILEGHSTFPHLKQMTVFSLRASVHILYELLWENFFLWGIQTARSVDKEKCHIIFPVYQHFSTAFDMWLVRKLLPPLLVPRSQAAMGGSHKAAAHASNATKSYMCPNPRFTRMTYNPPRQTPVAVDPGSANPNTCGEGSQVSWEREEVNGAGSVERPWQEGERAQATFVTTPPPLHCWKPMPLFADWIPYTGPV